MHLGFCPAQKLYEHAVGLRMQPTADFWQGFSHSVIEEKRGHEAFGCIAQCDPSVTAMTSLRIFQTAAKWWWQVENGLLVVFHGRIPDDFARFGVQGEHMTVDGGQIHLALQEADAAVGGVQLREVLWSFSLIAPQDIAGLGIERQHLILRRGKEHDPVVHDRGRLVPFHHP